MSPADALHAVLTMLEVTPEEAEEAVAEMLAQAIVAQFEQVSDLDDEDAGMMLKVLRSPRAVRFVALVAQKALERARA